MSTTLERPVILQRLRRETHPYHEALEQNEFNQALTAGTLTSAATERFLGKLYGFLVPYEAALRQHDFGPEWQLELRQRAHLIREDLPTADALPLCPVMPRLDTRARLLGALYVLEGSTLGGQVITRQLAQAGIGMRRYFSGHAERTGPLWKSFCQLLAAEATDDNEADIVAAAIQTFQLLHAWIEQR
ncbi:biliverdin-producing heme oxygenase [Hymenobacter jeollabukensis]|uniref:Biliverdin-producing heme oxygenase n=1 Tax=Hymenobacter jeollabukensis TaxID=2025313 RepID=A0A5R8WKV9_9BACT|nr:biliverdin-producing heme oxygenase [Hymenobacter jeollabukensis]TLM89215.1 biliverdin-producing heme oxygenase [Hymenobacter jeollabukensis]